MDEWKFCLSVCLHKQRTKYWFESASKLTKILNNMVLKVWPRKVWAVYAALAPPRSALLSAQAVGVNNMRFLRYSKN
jgi:hypothetical protein